MGTEHLSLDGKERRTRGGLPGPDRPRNRTRRHRAEAEEAFGDGQLSEVRGFGGPSSAPIRLQPGTAVLRGRDRQRKGSGPLPPRRGCRPQGRFPSVPPLRAASLFLLRLRGTEENSELSERICSTPLVARRRSQCP